MAQNPIAALDEAIAGLEQQLQADPRYVLLQNLKLARAGYDGKVEAPARTAEEASASPATGRAMSPMRAKALDLSAEYLADKFEPVKTKDIYAFIEQHGCELNGGPNNLASLLLRFPKTFKSYGRQGWTLAPKPGNGSYAPKTTEAADDLISRSASAASMSSLA